MALALVDKKEDDSCRWDDIESYNHASKKLFEAVQEDLENFQTRISKCDMSTDYNHILV